ncbi:MAG: OB-fold nucleic acid binding domain-containing protein [archaeon]
MTEKDIKVLIEEICAKTGKSEEEIRALIKAKTEKFSGLLTEQGATYLIQKELGLAKETYEQIPIGQLNEGMKGIEIKGIVEAIFPVKEFEKGGKKGKLKSFILSDETGEVRATLWNDHVEKFQLTRGSEITMSNIIVTKYNEKKQATLGFNGNIEIINKKEEEFGKISDLVSGMNGVNLIGRIMRKFPCKEFESGERKGKLCSFQIGDESAVVRVTAWNEKAEEMEKYNEGDAVEVLGAYTKEGRFGIELHLGYSAQITQTEKAVPNIIEILKEQMKEKKINELTDGENAVIDGKVTGVERGNFFYEVCNKCAKKISKNENGVLCETCGETTPRKNAVVSLMIEDDTAGIRVNFFGKTALAALGISQEELEKETSEKSSDILVAELNGKLIGKAIKVYGYQKTNSFSGNNEFSAREIV